MRCDAPRRISPDISDLVYSARFQAIDDSDHDASRSRRAVTDLYKSIRNYDSDRGKPPRHSNGAVGAPLVLTNDPTALDRHH